MRPLSHEEMEDIGLVKTLNPALQARKKEIRDFWNSGEAAAELPKFSTRTIETERDYYKRALRHTARELNIDWTRDVVLHVRKGRLYIARTMWAQTKKGGSEP